MSDKKQKKLTYAMTFDGAMKHIESARERFEMAKVLLELYLCGDTKLKHTDNVVDILAEYMTNMKFYEEFMENQMLSDNVIKNKKTGEDNIVVSSEDFTIISSYLVTTAACENELNTLGVSILKH